MRKQSLLSNYLFQFLHQALFSLMPLILAPYLARTLHERALGTYTYINSIAHFFVVAANLGIEIYGKRIIAKSAERREDLSRTFWSLFTLHIIISLAVILVYLLFAILKGGLREDKIICLIETIYVASALFDITWLFYGLENFSSVVIKSTLVKAAECILVFILVKRPEDIGTYALISACGTLVGQMVMLPYAFRLVRPVKFTAADVREHLVPLFSLAVVVFSVTLYTVFDKTMLGFMSTRENVAYYEYSHKIVKAPLIIVSALGKVMMPRASRLAAQKKEKELKTYLHGSVMFATCMTVGVMFGLPAVSGLFVRLYYGPAFAVCGNIIASMVPLVYIIGTGGILRSHYIIPYGMDRQYNICIFLNALINLVLNILLIPVLGVYGAVIGSLAAELFGFCFQMALCRKMIRPDVFLKSFLPFAGMGFLMFLVVRQLSVIMPKTVAGLLAEVAAGAIMYGTLSFLYIRRHCPDFAGMVLDRLLLRK